MRGLDRGKAWRITPAAVYLTPLLPVVSVEKVLCRRKREGVFRGGKKQFGGERRRVGEGWRGNSAWEGGRLGRWSV